MHATSISQVHRTGQSSLSSCFAWVDKIDTGCLNLEHAGSLSISFPFRYCWVRALPDFRSVVVLCPDKEADPPMEQERTPPAGIAPHVADVGSHLPGLPGTLTYVDHDAASRARAASEECSAYATAPVEPTPFKSRLCSWADLLRPMCDRQKSAT